MPAVEREASKFPVRISFGDVVPSYEGQDRQQPVWLRWEQLLCHHRSDEQHNDLFGDFLCNSNGSRSHGDNLVSKTSYSGKDALLYIVSIAGIRNDRINLLGLSDHC